MKLLTRDTDYAVRALVFMASRRGVVTAVSDLVRELQIPRPFLRKILQVLNKKRIVRSYKGQGGGFMLELPEHKILLTELMRIFQGSLNLNACLLNKRLCPEQGTCALRRRICKIESRMLAELRPITIAQLRKDAM